MMGDSGDNMSDKAPYLNVALIRQLNLFHASLFFLFHS